MDKESLLKRRQEAEDNFNTIQEKRAEKQQEVEQLDMELGRLQGEYRLINELIEKADTPKKVSKKAEVIDATSVEGA